jgi:hypothetical protein
MASNTPIYRDESAPHQGLLRGPSKGVRAWATFFEERADWLVDARKRWHESDPPRRTGRWRLVFGCGTSLVAVAAIVERVLGG